MEGRASSWVHPMRVPWRDLEACAPMRIWVLNSGQILEEIRLRARCSGGPDSWTGGGKRGSMERASDWK